MNRVIIAACAAAAVALAQPVPNLLSADTPSTASTTAAVTADTPSLVASDPSTPILSTGSDPSASTATANTASVLVDDPAVLAAEPMSAVRFVDTMYPGFSFGAVSLTPSSGDDASLLPATSPATADSSPSLLSSPAGTADNTQGTSLLDQTTQAPPTLAGSPGDIDAGGPTAKGLRVAALANGALDPGAVPAGYTRFESFDLRPDLNGQTVGYVSKCAWTQESVHRAVSKDSSGVGQLLKSYTVDSDEKMTEALDVATRFNGAFLGSAATVEAKFGYSRKTSYAARRVSGLTYGRMALSGHMLSQAALELSPDALALLKADVAEFVNTYVAPNIEHHHAHVPFDHHGPIEWFLHALAQHAPWTHTYIHA